MAAEWLEQFESIDVIGNGSFGVVRKVRRKTDGMIFARKDLNFSLMSERDKRQIVAEVNILKDLHHDNIVRYYDRMVDRDSGVLYILTEYCGGGDLSAFIKRSAREAEKAGLPPRGLDEDKVWNILMQLLKALVYCHHPNAISNGSSSENAHSTGHQRSPSLGGSDSESRRAQILHRDLKPDNVFLDEEENIKLGDFGLSKALLEQASFASTYVGTPYYMSPELMQEKAYDNKSDIWSLGCLVYELCALKPPFHEARTHAELATFIKNGRIPPLPRGYSSTLSSTIKAMLNLNPAMRPSAIQLLQHERIDYAIKLDEITKAIANIKAHKEQVIQRERTVVTREQALVRQETDVQVLQRSLSTMREQLNLAQAQVVQLQAALQEAQSRPSSPVDLAAALAARDAQHAERAAAHDLEVSQAWEAREAELLQAVRARELELEAAWSAREAGILAQAKTAAELHAKAIQFREAEVADAWERREEEIQKRWHEMEGELQARVKAKEADIERAWEEREEVLQREADERVREALLRARDISQKGALSTDEESSGEWQSVADLSTTSDCTEAGNISVATVTTDDETPRASASHSALTAALYKTPLNPTSGRPSARFLKTPLPALTKGLLEASSPPSHADLPIVPTPVSLAGAIDIPVPGSAMRGVVMTSTGQPLSTPGPAEYLRMFGRPLRPRTLNFGHIKEESEEVEHELEGEDDDATPQPLEKRSGIDVFVPKLSRDLPEEIPFRRTRSSIVPVTNRTGPLSPRKARQRSVSPGKRDRSSAAELKRAPSSNEVKKLASERTLVRTTTAPAGRSSLANGSKKPREPTAAASSSNTSGPPDGPISSSSSGSLQPSGLSASDSSSASTEPDSSSTAQPLKPSSSSNPPARKLVRATTTSSIPKEAPVYNLEDEENLPSPFIKRIDRDRFASTAPATTSSSRAKTTTLQPAPTLVAKKSKASSIGAVAGRRLSGATLLRVAAAKNATRAPSPGKSSDPPPAKPPPSAKSERPVLANARRAADEARQRLQRV